MPFLPGLSRRFLGEKLKLPSVATWWCGQPEALEYVRGPSGFPGHQAVISLHGNGACIRRPARRRRAPRSCWNGCKPGRTISPVRRCCISPPRRSGQESALTPRRVVLRVFVAAVGDSWAVMPGGLARVSPSLDSPVVSMQRGGGSKDTWVLSDGPVDRFYPAAFARFAPRIESRRPAICPAARPTIFSGSAAMPSGASIWLACCDAFWRA